MQTNHYITTNHIVGAREDHLYALTNSVSIHLGMKKSYDALVNAAQKDGIKLVVASGFRSFERQLMIWNKKFSGEIPIKNSNGETISTAGLTPLELVNHILLYSALPGASRHHWGCDIDVYAPNLLPEGYKLQLEPSEYNEGGPLAKLSLWLKSNAYQFGFYFPYANFQGGVAAEPWHISYLPLAQQYQQKFNITLLSQVLSHSNILGKTAILDNLEQIAKRYINNICEAPPHVIIPK